MKIEEERDDDNEESRKGENGEESISEKNQKVYEEGQKKNL